MVSEVSLFWPPNWSCFVVGECRSKGSGPLDA
uniref:Uncharacterized protein n=1 Tax=Heterorhabditis bacteriophora TaxID=37862 RepID=A0A1I7WZ63_HETBA